MAERRQECNSMALLSAQWAAQTPTAALNHSSESPTTSFMFVVSALSTGCRIHFYPLTFLFVTLSLALFEVQMNFCLEITIIARCRQGHKNWGVDSFQLFTPFHRLIPTPSLSSMPLIFQLIHWSLHWSVPLQ
jgi:hypothetical protein